MLDTVIQGGTLVDGTGTPKRRADVGIRAGRVVAVGPIDEPAARTVDAGDQLVAPGFVDLHTHYDAQLFWDPTASPSPLHGVTTVFGGNCGFSLAPNAPADSDYLCRLMARVEGMPLSALQAGLDWSWGSFADWLDRLDGATALNAGFLVGHSALRRAVLGDESGGPADPGQVAAMVTLLGAALDAGALGVSTSRAPTHHDGDGAPVPSRAAGDDELAALAAEVGAHPGTTVELIVAGCLNGFSDEEVALLTRLSTLADRPLNWNVLAVSAANPGSTAHQLEASDRVRAGGGALVALTLPHNMAVRLSFEQGAILDGFPGWREVFALPVEPRMTALRDPAVRARLNEGAHSEEAGILRHLAVWERLRIDETFSNANRPWEGHSVGEVARQRDLEPFDALLDVVLADRLRTGLRPPIPVSEDDWRARAEVWVDPRAVVGGSDAGAHLDTMCGAVYSTSLLGEGVRRRQLLSWEEAVRQLSDVPAHLYGLRERGRLAPGYWADVVVFDPDTVGAGPERTRDDLPGGASRLYAESTGVTHVLVNGTEVVGPDGFTGDLPGSVLRSGRDTRTVTAATASSG